MSGVQTRIGKTVALSLIRSELAGFRGYPSSELGEDRFARELATVALSVGHATAIVESFDSQFPTIKELRDVAVSLRPKFELPEDSTEAWRQQYGAPAAVRPDFQNRVSSHPDEQMWAALKRYFTDREKGFPGWAAISWRRIYEAMEQLGYPVSNDMRKL